MGRGGLAGGLALGALLLMCGLATSGASAPPTDADAAATRVVTSPRPGAHIRTNTVRLVVPAGNEWHDVDARLNGVRIGRHFARAGHGRRVLRVSASHGLRHGVNVLRVKARRGTTERQATVRFRVVRRLPLVGAGRDRLHLIQRPERVRGKLGLRKGSRSPTRIRWAVVAAPANSRFAKRAKRKVGRASLAAVRVPLKRVGRPRALTTRFRPDKLGTYRLQLKAAVGGRTLTDNLTVDAIPRSAVQVVDTAVVADEAPAIRVGDTAYTAPPMQGNNSWSGVAGNIKYSAMWQVVTLRRKSLGLVWNRTYGLCEQPGLAPLSCRQGSDGKITYTTVGDELRDVESTLAAQGETALVIASSHSDGAAGSSRFWSAPSGGGFADGVDGLRAMGFPSGDAEPDVHALISDAGAGAASAIGVAGMTPGQAQIKIIPGDSGEIRGYLSADSNNNFDFNSSEHIPFDTRPPMACQAGQCTVTQTVGTATATATIPEGQRGYMVSTWNDKTLKLGATKMFSIQESNEGPIAMMAFLRGIGPGVLVAITSVRTPGQGNVPMPDTYDANNCVHCEEIWWGLADQVAAVGGTRHVFNTNAAETGSLYSLLGSGGAGEANGIEISSATGRLQGALVPNSRSVFTPVNVSADGPPADRLARLVAQAPSTKWTYDDNPRVHSAIKYIGSKIPQLGASPRQAYWYQSDLSGVDLGTVQYPVPKLGQDPGFGPDDFSAAKAQLRLELGWVAQVRKYLTELATPTTTSGQKAWEDATKLNHDLTDQLKDVSEQAAVEYAWFDVVSSLLDMTGDFAALEKGFKGFAKLTEVFAASTLLAGSLMETTYGGGAPPSTEKRTVQVDQIATEMEHSIKSTTENYKRIAKATVSDPVKLAELGHWAVCEPADGGCVDPKTGTDYSEYADPTGGDSPEAVSAASRAIDRVLYQRIVPLAFKVWNTGTTSDPDPSRFSCLGPDNPFPGSPPMARASLLVQVDANHPGTQTAGSYNRWETHMLVTRSGFPYAWPSQEILNRMFNGLTSEDTGADDGLGLSPQFLQQATPRYTPGGVVDCGWAP